MASQDQPKARSSRSAVANRAPTKLLAGLGSRRTSQEVKAANEAADAAAEKAREKAQIRQTQIKKRIGELEDALHREDAHRKKTAARPDLHEKPIAPFATRSQKKGGEETNKEKLKIIIRPPASTATNQGPYPTGSMRDPGVIRDAEAGPVQQSRSPSPASRNDNTPTGSDDELVDSKTMGANMVDSESEHASSERAPSDEPEGMNFDLEDDGDREDDSDYEEGREEEEEEEEESEGEASDDGDSHHHQRRKLSKPPQQNKAEKALKFREEVSEHRKTKSTSSISHAVQNELQKRKRRALEDDNYAGDSRKQKVQSKRPKYEEPSGLLSNFRSVQRKKLNASRSQSEPSDGDELGEYNGGVFDQDEDENMLRAARESKANTSTVRGSKPETSVRIVEPPPPSLPLAITRRKFKKEHCKKSNLPFPPALANRCRELWDHQFKSTLIAWNAALRQPFSSGTLLSSEVRVVWRKVFKDLAPLEDDDERWAIVETVAGDFLLNWRSEIGKTAITVTVSNLRNELMDRIED
ncbi:hypothetical protein EST38_g13994, partial [Candolleomyces aberdarensis]